MNLLKKHLARFNFKIFYNVKLKEAIIMQNAWQGFKTGRWTKEIDVRGFIQLNYTPYEGDDSFLAGATENTKQLWDEVMELFNKIAADVTTKCHAKLKSI